MSDNNSYQIATVFVGFIISILFSVGGAIIFKQHSNNMQANHESIQDMLTSLDSNLKKFVLSKLQIAKKGVQNVVQDVENVASNIVNDFENVAQNTQNAVQNTESNLQNSNPNQIQISVTNQ